MVRRIAVVVALAVVLAGCNAIGPSADGDPQSTQTVTPLPVLTDTDGPDETRSLPPGVAANGSLDPGPLVDAHYRALDGRSFTWTYDYERTVSAGNGSVAAVRKRMSAAADGSYRLDQNLSTGQRATLYADETGRYLRSSFDDASERRSLGGPVDYSHYLSVRETVGRFLSVNNASVSVVERSGQTYVRVHVTHPPTTLRNGHVKQSIGNYTATAYVTPEGLIRTMVVEYDYTLRGEHVRVSLRSGFDALDATTVERPAWVDTLAENGTATPAATDGTPSTESPTDSTPESGVTDR
ncbi:hypothetical protein [Halosimplex salinum]|uniref:hypothetical protein n=1 Tax=Halosimplex salinum TaxID=1710538 RepID=UPI000F46CE26|nr:hypothetical protein [Halosimplex salinum]